MLNLFDTPTKDENGVWHTNKFAQLRDDAHAILDTNSASWLGALGLVLLLQKLGVLYGSLEALLTSAGLSTDEQEKLKPFFDNFTVYALPKGYAVDAEAVNPLVQVKPSDIHEDKRDLIIVDLLALRKLTDKCCDICAPMQAVEADLLKSK